MKALKMAWEPVVSSAGVMFHSEQGSRLYEQAVPAVIVAIPDQAEYELAWKLLG